MRGWKRKKGKYIRAGILGVGVLLVITCWQNLESTGEAPALKELWNQMQGNVYMKVLNTHMPSVTWSKDDGHQNLWELAQEKLSDFFPVYAYTETVQEYATQVESQITYEMIVAREGIDENYKDGVHVGAADGEQADGSNDDSKAQGEDNQGEAAAGEQAPAAGEETAPQETQEEVQQTSGVVGATEPVADIAMDKLNDFDFLIQNFYQVDKTTTINSSQLNAETLLSKDMHIKGSSDAPQILIYHTHSQEGYTDSDGTAATTVVGVADYLTQLLTDNYGLNVMHHTGEYDVEDRDNAYSYAGPALEQILAENPSIEVVIDLHRDGVAETTHLVSEVNGKQTAKVMFFNGLSRTTKNGDITSLPNPNLEDNLALSLQMKLSAEQYYPGFTRGIYLKGYRYNLHYCPKSLLVEVGAQTNTVQEAMNAMEPLADLLNKVLAPQQ